MVLNAPVAIRRHLFVTVSKVSSVGFLLPNYVQELRSLALLGVYLIYLGSVVLITPPLHVCDRLKHA